MLFRRFAQFLGCEFRRHIALRGCQQFEAHHKLPDGGGAEQRRKKVCVKMPLRMIVAVGRTLVKTHRVRERSLKQIVIAR